MGVRTSEKGFTLMELIIVISLLGILMVGATDLFLRTFRGSGKTNTEVNVEQNAQYALSVMNRFIKNAQKVVEVDGSSCPNAGPSLIVLNWNNSEIEFSLSENNRIASNGAEITSSKVLIENLLFTCQRQEGVPDVVVVSFTASQIDTSQGVSSSSDYSSTINLRNF